MQLVYNFVLVACLVIGSWAFNGYGGGYAPTNIHVAQNIPTIPHGAIPPPCALYEGPVCGKTKKCRYNFHNLCDLEKANTASLKWEIDHFGPCKEDCSKTTTTPAPTNGTATSCNNTVTHEPVTDSLHQININNCVKPLYSQYSQGYAPQPYGK